MAFGQTASLRGQVVDETGAVVPKAIVTIAGPSGAVKTAAATANGSYSLTGLTPGDYSVRATAPKLDQQPVRIRLTTGLQTLRLELRVAGTVQRMTVQESAGPTLSTESSNNASAVVLKGEDLKALADDPEDLMTDLQALAGPSAGTKRRLDFHRRL